MIIVKSDTTPAESTYMHALYNHYQHFKEKIFETFILRNDVCFTGKKNDMSPQGGTTYNQTIPGSQKKVKFNSAGRCPVQTKLKKNTTPATEFVVPTGSNRFLYLKPKKTPRGALARCLSPIRFPKRFRFLRALCPEYKRLHLQTKCRLRGAFIFLGWFGVLVFFFFLIFVGWKRGWKEGKVPPVTCLPSSVVMLNGKSIKGLFSPSGEGI